jgi:hypothetical protein
VAEWPGADDSSSGRRSRALQELACSLRDQGLGTPEISCALSLKLEAEDRLLEIESGISQIEIRAAETEVFAREREARLSLALNQLEHERLFSPENAEVEQRIVEVTQKILAISSQLQLTLAALQSSLAEKRQALEQQRSEVGRHDERLADLLRQARPQVTTPQNEELLRLFCSAGLLDLFPAEP